MGRSPKADMTSIKEGRKAFMTLYIFALRDHKMRSLHLFSHKTWAFNPKIASRGPVPNIAVHKAAVVEKFLVEFAEF